MHALQEYTVTHYPEMPSKFGELLLRMPELSRVCQVRKHLQTSKKDIAKISLLRHVKDFQKHELNISF